MQVMEAAQVLSKAIQESPEYLEYSRLKEEVDADAGIKSLIREYRKMQANFQMRIMSGQQIDVEETQRFQQLNMLLFADQRTSNFLLAEIRLQQLMADIFKLLTQAADIELPTTV